LSTLAERDETPTHGAQSTLNAIVSSPAVPHTPAAAGRIKPAFEEMHPEKVHQSTAPQAFDFRFARPTPQLGPEAQKIRDELRGEALRIKAKLISEQGNEDYESNLDASQARRIATPRGKVGRFSGVHMAEFKKMDSIAGHPSAFRAQPGRFTPVNKSLKRSQSTARLGDRDNLSRCQDPKIATDVERTGNITPAKRARVASDLDEQQVSTPKPASTPLSRSQSILASITTPTQASLARASGSKQLTHIPTLSSSPSKQSLHPPRRLTKSATTGKIGTLSRSNTSQTAERAPGKFDRVKSILRHPVASPEKPKSTKLALFPLLQSPNKVDLNKELPSLPATPTAQGTKFAKHINFTPTTVSKNMGTMQNSPSPYKSGIPRSKANLNHGAVCYPSLAGVVDGPAEVNYPLLTSSRPLPEPPCQGSPPPSVPGTFTFRSDNTIIFGTSPRGFGSSPGQASLRQVRPSILPSSMPGSFPDADKENIGGLPAISRRMRNKKRNHADSDDSGEDQPKGSPTKRRKKTATEAANPVASKTKIPSPVKKGVLSLSRLNMLARPKLRK
jgi:hypothetical protein